MGFSVGDIVQSNGQTGLIIKTKWGYQGWDWITVHWYSFQKNEQLPYTYVYPVDKTIRATFKVIT
jgi:hypothetical protein